MAKTDPPFNRNVFADLGFDDAEEMLIKAELARRIAEVIQKKRMPQTQVAKVLQVDQPKISRLLNGRLSDFSTERLVKFLLRLGHDIKITIKKAPSSHERGRVSVVSV